MSSIAAVAFMSQLDTRATGENEWVLLADFKAKVFYADGNEEWIIVPAGFVTDLASVPRIPMAFWLFGSRGRRAAVLHDWLYQQASRPRSFCDEVLYVAMQSEESWFTRAAMFLGVRIGGFAFYKRHTENQP